MKAMKLIPKIISNEKKRKKKKNFSSDFEELGGKNNNAHQVVRNGSLFATFCSRWHNSNKAVPKWPKFVFENALETFLARLIPKSKFYPNQIPLDPRWGSKNPMINQQILL